MKKRHLNTLKIASLTLMLGCFAVGGVYNHYQDKQQNHVVKVERKVQPKYASYDDDNDSLELNTTDVLYSYVNFYNLINDYYTNNEDIMPSINLNYDETTFYTEDLASDGFHWAIADNETYTNIILSNSDYKFYVNDDEVLQYSLTILVYEEDYYADVKNAIQLDIQANQPVSQGESIIGAITSGLGLIPDLANEFLTGFSALFWNSETSSLTTFSYFALVFLGIAITMAVVKLVLAIIRGNTGA